MRIHIVGCQSHGIFGLGFAQKIMFGNHIIRHHPAGFTDIQLTRPVAGFGKFIRRQAPVLHFSLNGRYYLPDRRVVGDKPPVALYIGHMPLKDGFPFLIAAVGPVEVLTNKISGDGAVVIGIGFSVFNPVEFIKGIVKFRPKPHGKISLQQNIPAPVIVGRLRERHAIGSHIRHANPEVIGLNAMIPLPGNGDNGFNTRKQSAIGITGHDIWTHITKKLVLVPDLLAVIGFTVGRIAFPACDIGDARRRHQVTFIGGIDKVIGIDRQTVFGGNPHDTSIGHHHTAAAIQEGLVIDFHPGFLHHILKYGQGNRRLECPVFGCAIFGSYTLIEFPCDSLNRFLVAKVGPAQPPRRQAAQPDTRVDNHGTDAQPL